jgi:hypothetical protein
MKEIFNINIVLTREQNDSEFDDISKVKSEITSWLEDLDFTVEFPTETYHEKAKDMLFEYVSYSDIPEITKRLEEIELDLQSK